MGAVSHYVLYNILVLEVNQWQTPTSRDPNALTHALIILFGFLAFYKIEVADDVSGVLVSDSSESSTGDEEEFKDGFEIGLIDVLVTGSESESNFAQCLDIKVGIF